MDWTEGGEHQAREIVRRLHDAAARLTKGEGHHAGVRYLRQYSAAYVRLKGLEAEVEALEAKLAAPMIDMSDLHPNMAELYRRKVERLSEALSQPEERDEAAQALRARPSYSGRRTREANDLPPSAGFSAAR